MSLQLTFKLEMRSDYHVGAGHGRGTEVDSALLRDADGVSVVRGTTLNGLLRDSVWRLLQLAPLVEHQKCRASGKDPAKIAQQYCGQYSSPDHEVPLCPICRLFGSPLAQKRWYIGSARPVAQPALADPADPANDRPGQDVTRVRVNPRTRRAAPHQLFSEEQGGKQTFTFTATCASAEEDALDDAALLVAAARFVRELGRARRRGQGECLISLTSVAGVDLSDNPQEELLTRFREHWLHGAPAPISASGTDTLATEVSWGNLPNHPLRWRILMRLEEPLIIAERAAAGNRFHSRDVIPGTALRGALAGRAAQAYDLDDPATYEAFLHVFLRDGVRFPTLHPLYRDHDDYYPAIPVPYDGFGCKVNEDHPVDWATQGQVRQCSTCGSPVQALHGEFYPLKQHQPGPFKPQHRVEMHIRVDPETGRVEEGQLFDYAPLEAGQFFVGDLQSTDAATWQLLETFTGLTEGRPLTLRLGKARQRGYGRITVWAVPVPEDQPSSFGLLPVSKRVAKDATTLTLTLLTDTIIQDGAGRFATGFQESWLRQHLELPVSITKDRDYAGQRPIDGYNTQWHLPRWRAVALEAGSSVHLQLDEPVGPQVLARLRYLEQEGIGERRNEGYGQLIFNHPLYVGFTGVGATEITLPQELHFASLSTAPRKDLPARWQRALDAFAEDHHHQWQQIALLGQPLMAVARWLQHNQHREIARLIEELGAFGVANEDLKSLIREQGERAAEYGDREQQNRLGNQEQGVIWLLTKLLQELRDTTQSFWPEGIGMIAERLADLAESKKEVQR
jgi:CRISPR-associated protein Csx10